MERCLALLKLFSISLEINEDYVKYVIFCAVVTRLLSWIPEFKPIRTISRLPYTCPYKRSWSLDEYFLHEPFIMFAWLLFFPPWKFYDTFYLLFWVHSWIVLYERNLLWIIWHRNREKDKEKVALLLILVTVAIFICSLPFHLLTWIFDNYKYTWVNESKYVTRSFPSKR